MSNTVPKEELEAAFKKLRSRLENKVCEKLLCVKILLIDILLI